MSWIEYISPELNMAGAGSCENEQTQPLKQTPDNLLFMVIHGHGVVCCNNQKLPLREGDWIIIPPASKYTISQTSENFWAQWLNFNWVKQSLIGALDHDSIPEEISSGSLNELDRCAILWDIIWHRWNSDDVCEMKTCNALLLEMLIRLFHENEHHANQTVPEAPDETIPEEQLALLMKRLLDEMPPNHKSIEEVLSGMNFSYEYMDRIFQKSFGISPLEYLIQLRKQQAEKKGQPVEDDGTGLIKVEYKNGFYAYEHEPQLRRRFDFSGYDRY